MRAWDSESTGSRHPRRAHGIADRAHGSQTGRTESQVRPRLLPATSQRRATTTEVPAVAAPAAARETVFDIRDMSVVYGAKRALGWTTLRIYRHLITAVIGPPDAASRPSCAASTG